ncbi:MAG: 16S rRNA (guanine(966)-N(2))-methyltransferase RsmD [Actinomycetota bacterium]|nr:16S rRNA (guanine(966)-N(2))-methyltransferase RsmD [Actinomycetota bacterium]
MTRIVGGTARGRTLAVPPRGTRPTADRTREALFNRLDTLLEVSGSRVLDLYAGSGALGLEALSRGAAQVTFVDNDRRAAAVIEDNAAVVDARAMGGGVVRVVVRAVDAFLLARAPSPEARYDVIFADPPYATSEDEVAATLAAVCTPAWCADGAVIVLERSARGPVPRWPDGVEALASKRYGEASLWYGRRR